jgi:DNA invertase Pin-like site-specific DNA recombinase
MNKQKREIKEKKGGFKMKNQKKAIGYVCDIPIVGTDEVIGKEDQRIRILNYAKKENIDLFGIYEDDEYTEPFMDRPGVKKILECNDDFDHVLVERVWCLSRKMKELKPFIERLEELNVELVASSCLWDCVSQQVRHRYMGSLAEKQRKEARARVAAKKRLKAA